MSIRSRSTTPSAVAISRRSVHLEVEEKVGIGVGAGAFAVIIATFLFLLWRRRKSNGKTQDMEKGPSSGGRARLGHKGANLTASVNDSSICGPKPPHSPSSTNSSIKDATTTSLPAPSPPTPPPAIAPKSSKRPPSLVVVPPVLSVEDAEKPASPASSASQTRPAVPEKSAKRRTLLLEDDVDTSRPDTAEDITAAASSPAADEASQNENSLQDKAAELAPSPSGESGPGPLFMTVPEALRRISEDSIENRSGAKTPDIPAKAAARMSITLSNPADQGSGMKQEGPV